MSSRAQKAITEWKAAYKLCNGREYDGYVWYHEGWVSFSQSGITNLHRVSQVEEMTRVLVDCTKNSKDLEL